MLTNVNQVNFNCVKAHFNCGYGVVIDVVFVKKMLGPKKFWLKKIHIQKNCSGKKELSQKKLWSKKMLTEK